VHEGPDLSVDVDRHAKHGDQPQLVHGLGAGEPRVLHGVLDQDALAGAQDLSEHGPAEAADGAVQDVAVEMVQHAVGQLALARDLDEQPAVRAGVIHGLLQNRPQHVDGLRDLGQDAAKRSDQGLYGRFGAAGQCIRSHAGAHERRSS
jgi:hypothetical protein